MLKLNRIGANVTEVEIGRALVLFSYATPVACHLQGQGYFRTEERFSVTTSRHINSWVRGKATLRPQSFFNELVAV